MSNEISKAFVQQFSDNFIHLIDQEGSMLKDKVRIKEVTGKYAHFDRIGRGNVYEKTGRHADLTYNDTPNSRRRIVLKDYQWADLIDEEDEVRMLIDPKSDYARAAAAQMGIKFDQILIEALNGNASSIDENDSSSNVALPTTQVVDEDFGTADSNLTLAKLIEAKKILLGHGGSVMGKATCVVNADALASLLNDTTVTSADYNSVKSLVNGEIDTFMGFKFVVVKDGLLPGTADGTDTDPVRCFVFLDRSVGLALGRDVTIRMDKLPQKGYATQVYAAMTAGATRIEEEGVVAIECVQS